MRGSAAPSASQESRVALKRHEVPTCFQSGSSISTTCEVIVEIFARSRAVNRASNLCSGERTKPELPQIPPASHSHVRAGVLCHQNTGVPWVMLHIWLRGSGNQDTCGQWPSLLWCEQGFCDHKAAVLQHLMREVLSKGPATATPSLGDRGTSRQVVGGHAVRAQNLPVLVTRISTEMKARCIGTSTA